MTVLEALRARGRMTALDLRRLLGLAHEDVYLELVRLEGAGLVGMRRVSGEPGEWYALGNWSQRR